MGDADDEIKKEIENLFQKQKRFRFNTTGMDGRPLVFTVMQVLSVNGGTFKFLDKNGKEVLCRYDTVKQIEYL